MRDRTWQFPGRSARVGQGPIARSVREQEGCGSTGSVEPDGAQDGTAPVRADGVNVGFQDSLDAVASPVP